MDHYIAYTGYCGTALAAMRLEYLDEIMRHVNDLSSVGGTLMQPPLTAANEREWLEKCMKKNDRTQVFAILHADKESGREYRYMGHTSLFAIAYPSCVATSGTVILDKACQGKGIGTEAKLLLLRHAFNTLGLRKVSSEVKEWNGNSLGHLLKCGYKVIGCRKEHHFHNGTYVNEYLLEVFRSDFDSIWQKYEAAKTLPVLDARQRVRMRKLVSSALS